MVGGFSRTACLQTAVPSTRLMLTVCDRVNEIPQTYRTEMSSIAPYGTSEGTKRGNTFRFHRRGDSPHHPNSKAEDRKPHETLIWRRGATSKAKRFERLRRSAVYGWGISASFLCRKPNQDGGAERCPFGSRNGVAGTSSLLQTRGAEA